MPGTQGIVPPYLYPNHTLTGFEHRPAKALEYLNKSNYSQYKEPIKLNTIARFPYKEIAEFLQREWAKIGIKVEIEINTVPTHMELSSNGKLSFFRSSWLGDYPDPENFLTLFYGPNLAPKGPNRARFSNKKYDELYQKALVTTNDEERFAIYVQMEEILQEECPYLVLFYDEVVRLTQKYVTGLEANPMNGLILEKVDFVKGATIKNDY
jgi:peptide/nickel transport system substrate-binding protein